MNTTNSTPTSQYNSFEEFLDAVNLASQIDKDQLIQDYLDELRLIPNIPILEGNKCIFLYYGNVTTVEVAGDFTGWSPVSLSRITSTNLWYLKKQFPLDARLDYKLVVNGNWILDPENDALILGGFGYNSEIAMIEYIPNPSIQFYDYIPHGTIDTIPNFHSPTFDNYRTIKVYLPPNYDPNGSTLYPTLYVTDGIEYIDIANFDNVLDYLLFNGLISEVIVVFIPPIDRSNEYFNEKLKFRGFITSEIIPYIETNYKVSVNRTDRGLMGASLGGYISFYTGFNEEDTFGLIGSQSGYFPFDLIGMYGSRIPNIKYYMDIGTFETSVSGTDLFVANEEMNNTLTNKGYTFKYQKFNEGHSWGNWRAHLDDILTYFFPGSGVSQNTTTFTTTEVTTISDTQEESTSSQSSHSTETNTFTSESETESTETTIKQSQTTTISLIGMISFLFVSIKRRMVKKKQ
ncbi:MAG: alpha/beta hydrolase-fold protein [Candidatus Hodarchaeales archaeon]